MNVQKEKITPKKAMDYLTRNVNNRPLSRVHVTRYAKAMAAGEWQVNGDMVRFNGNGDLIDGQHRLTACVQSGVAFESYVMRGLPHEAFDTIDQGNRRKLDHILARRGESNYVILASAIRSIGKYKSGWVVNHEEMRPAQMDELLEKHSGVRDSVHYSVLGKNKQKFASKSLVSAFHYMFTLVDEKAATQFWDRVLAGEKLVKSMPEFTLRTTLINNSISTSKLHSDTIAAYTIKSWNSVFGGASRHVLKWDAREDFPAIAGLDHSKL